MALHNSPYRLYSPAKINLFLRVLKKRSDGYHELATLLQAVTLFDTLDFSLLNHTQTDRLICSDPSLPIDTSNLVFKAINLFKHKTQIPFSIHVSLNKKIPVEAGLGGGSSNAATTLWALNELLGNPVNEPTLRLWGSELGSDVPFFFSSGTAYCTGRGECVESIKTAPNESRPICIVKPSLGNSTAKVYHTLSLSSLSPRDPLQQLIFYQNNKISLFNDLEEAAFALTPSLRDLKNRLCDAGFDSVLLAGSGSSFICFGNGSLEKFENITAYAVSLISRSEGKWYYPL